MCTYQVNSLEEADQIIREHERKTKTSFTLLRSTKNFGCINLPACSNDENEVRFETVGVPYCGVPFFIAGLKILQCQTTKGRTTKKKKDVGSPSCFRGLENEEILVSKLSSSKKKSFRARPNNCTATVIMKEVIYYPEFKITEHSKHSRLTIGKQLKEALKSKSLVMKDRIIYVTVPSSRDHFGHPVGTVSSNRLMIKQNRSQHLEEINSLVPSKTVYCPIKHETSSGSLVNAKRIKVDEDDIESRAREVRETLQSIMSLTYKPSVCSAFNELLKDLVKAKSKYQQSLDSLLLNTSNSSSHSISAETTSINVVEASPTIHSINPSPILTVQTVKGNEVSVPLTWQPASRPVSLASSTGVLSGTATVVAVTGLPLTVSTSSSSNQSTGGQSIVAVPSAVAVQANHSSTSVEANTQETSIFIEAMEAIFNSQM